jgi:hypothetical protein
MQVHGNPAIGFIQNAMIKKRYPGTHEVIGCLPDKSRSRQDDTYTYMTVDSNDT